MMHRPKWSYIGWHWMSVSGCCTFSSSSVAALSTPLRQFDNIDISDPLSTLQVKPEDPMRAAILVPMRKVGRLHARHGKGSTAD